MAAGAAAGGGAPDNSPDRIDLEARDGADRRESPAGVDRRGSCAGAQPDRWRWVRGWRR